MKQVIITKGLPASGKTTWVLEQLEKNSGQYKRINKDDLRTMLDGSKWSSNNEKLILKIRNQLILMALDEGKHVIIDDTNLHPKHELQIKELVKGKAEVIIQDFTNVPLEECIRRDLARERSVGERVIRGMWKQFLAPAPAIYVPPANAPTAIICDLDGTLALLNGRNPYDASTCGNDIPNLPAIDIVKKYSTVVYVSGREKTYFHQTASWLDIHGLPHGELYMREAGDKRKDAVVKRELFDKHIRDNYRVLFVLDDRNQVVQMWRLLGLTCLQVAEGDF